MSANLDQFLESVERADNMPVIVCPYGVRKVQIDGKTYLTPMTKDDLVNALRAEPNFDQGKIERLIRDGNPCDWTGYQCIKRTGCQSYCLPETGGGSQFSFCECQ